jgi:hypothetical protein
MAETRSIGLTYIKVGEIAQDGGMGTSLSALGVTYQDTAELVQDDPEITNIYSEENDEPEEVIETQGPKKLKWSIMNYDPDQLIRVLGGTSTGNSPNKVWSAPISKTPIELSIEILTKKGVLLQIPRAKITAKINFQFRKKGVALVDIEATILTPTKTNTAPLTSQKLPES